MKKKEYTTEEGVAAIIALQAHVGTCEDPDHAKKGWLSMTVKQQKETMFMYETMKAEGYFEVATTAEQAIELLEKHHPRPVKVHCKSAKRLVKNAEEATRFFAYMAAPPPKTNEIVTFFHCKNCIEDRPKGTSPRQWGSLEVGWTPHGFQVWCKRCEMNVTHVDFGGAKLAGQV